MRIAAIFLAAASLCVAPALAQPASGVQGRMTLQPERLPGMCLTLSDAGSVSMPCDGSARQFFEMPAAGAGPIRNGDKCVAPRGAGYYPQLFAETCDGSPEQTWTMNAEGELRSGAERCISVMGQASRTGTTIFGAECPREGSAHQWKVRYVDFTNVIEASLESKARPGMCIGHDTGVGLYPCSDNYGQVISLDRKAMGQMRLKSSCFSGGYAFGALGLGECWDLPQQKWVVMETGQVVNAGVQCIELVNENGRDVLRTKACKLIPEQQWVLRAPKKP
ncbi:MAG: ricin-type beta-trefoil lectin domain protein [Hyphomonadaceae bacterium]|nr:ricin-type beta-trefoil lectin domain protein [Hyphomonadaceae bacterium]